MTTISIADRSTVTRGDDALGSKSFSDAAPETSTVERRLYVISPEIQAQVEIQSAVLDNWVAFKTAPAFVEKIYNGKELAIDMEYMRDELILPEYREQQRVFLEESADIVGRQIPSIRTRRRSAERDAAEHEKNIADIDTRVAAGQGSAEVAMSRASYYKQMKRRQKDADNLTQDIPRAVQNARIKEAMFYTIGQFLNNPNEDVIQAKIDEITLASKKIALNQVILSFKADMAVLDANNPQNTAGIESLSLKIELLEAELAAHEKIQMYDDAVEEARNYYDETLKTREVVASRPTVRERVMGGLARVATIGGVFAK
ncbi:MAG: hypothetical protein V4611_02390 [Patescibacteria group bacterium]